MNVEDRWVSFVMQRTIEDMRSKNLTIVGWRDNRGRLRYALSNNEIVHGQTVRALKEKGLLEQMESDEEAARYNEVHYRLKAGL